MTVEVARSRRAASRTGFREPSPSGSALRASILHAFGRAGLRAPLACDKYLAASRANVERAIAQYAP